MGNMNSLTALRVVQGKRKLCLARKQRFAGAIGCVAHPFLGVRIRKRYSPYVDEYSADVLKLQSLLSPHGLMLLMLSAAWSEDTMGEVHDSPHRFVEAMRAGRGEPTAAEEMGYSV